MLDLLLPGGPPHVMVLSLLHLVADLREKACTLLTPTQGGTSAKVLLRLAVQVGGVSLMHVKAVCAGAGPHWNATEGPLFSSYCVSKGTHDHEYLHEQTRVRACICIYACI